MPLNNPQEALVRIMEPKARLASERCSNVEKDKDMVEVNKNQNKSDDYNESAGEDGDFLENDSQRIERFVTEFMEDGERLDKVLAGHLPEISRSRLKTLIEEGAVKVDGVVADKPKMKVSMSTPIEVNVKPRLEDQEFIAVPMDLDVVYEDDDILVVNKPAGLVVHPAAGHWDDTLLNGLLAYDPVFKQLPRAGIVHRLDRDTTGLMVVAKTEAAQLDLVRQLQERTVKREYWALTRGHTPPEKVIDVGIERDPRNPLRFTTGNSSRSKPAVTTIRTVQTNEINKKPFSWVAARLKTGRTHQIRVHMESIGFPLIGDPLYRNKLPKPKEDGSVLNSFNRQALHASRLGLIHPVTKEVMEWFAEPPEDFRNLMDELGFGPWDQPSEVFGDPVVLIDKEEEEPSYDGVGRISSWSDFDFGDEEDDTDMSVWEIKRTGE